MDSRYDHTQHEQKMYDLWQQADAFNPDSESNQKLQANHSSKSKSQPFSIIMPPPNANDPLHIGHAAFISIEDVLTRFHRMRGDDTLWLPGTDHAGIETQFVFEKKLNKQGQSRFSFDRDTLYQKIWDYVQDNSGVALEQMKKIGASADWSRYKFTLDKDIVSQVLQTFEKLHTDGLIYKDKRLVNYCTHCGTSYSELEVDYVDRNSPLYYLKYGPFTLATTRPETKFGDTAVAVHPTDTRYQKYVGQTLEIEGLNGPFQLKVIADEYVDPEFGTGVVKITPYHDFNDFDVWQRHQQELPEPKQVIDFDGKLNQHAGKYAGMRINNARQQIVADLKSKNLLEKIDEKYTNRVGTCYRCGRVIEPLPLPQFFVKVEPLVKKTLEALDNKQVKIHGAGYDKILRHWLENLRDWNISRQIVWGIRIPVWYEITPETTAQMTVGFINENGQFTSGNLKEILEVGTSLNTVLDGLQTLSVAETVPYQISTTKPEGDFIQETDTFDTWFSSGQWPVITLQATQPQDFERFYPTSVMETAYDILMFWVMRMLMFGIYLTGEVPFKDVYLHGLVRDEKGQKMSKSKGNVTNPLEVIQEYGADALRLALVIRSTPGLDKSIGRPDFKAARNLTNKLWNAARFIDMSQDKMILENAPLDSEFNKKLDELNKTVTQQLSDLKIGLAAETLYTEFWHWFCDECIEQAKGQKLSKMAILKGLQTFLLLFHPFMPFVTEAVWQQIQPTYYPDSPKLLVVSPWPQS